MAITGPIVVGITAQSMCPLKPWRLNHSQASRPWCVGQQDMGQKCGVSGGGGGGTVISEGGSSSQGNGLAGDAPKRLWCLG